MTNETASYLPFEVWDLILRNNFDITAPNARHATIDVARYSTLATLCSVSSYTRDVAEPLLYQSFSTRHGIAFQTWAHNILSFSRLACHVYELDLNFLDSGTPHKSRIDYAYNSFFYEVARSKGMDQDYSDLASYVHSWIPLVSLLPVLSNPIRLMLRMGMVSPEIASCFFETIPARILELRLDTAIYNFFTSRRRAPRTGPICLLESSGLKYVHLHGPLVLHREFDPNDPPLELRVNEDVKWFRLTNISPDASIFAYLQSLFPNLEALEYHVHGQGPMAVDYYSLGLKIYLSSFRKTLRLLGLDSAMSNFQPFSAYPIQSLADLINLEELRIESMAILHRNISGLDSSQRNTGYKPYFEPQKDNLFKDLFPMSIRTLRITHVYRNIEKSLMELAENVRDWLPSLAEIQIDLGRSGLETSQHYNSLENVIVVRELLASINAERQEALLSRQLRSLGMARTIHSDLRWLDNAGYNDPRIRGLSVEIPASSVHDENDLSSIDDYIKAHANIRHLPIVWQTIIARFNAAGVRFKLSHSKSSPYCQEIDLEQPFTGWISTQQYQPVVRFDSDSQMAKWLWIPHFQRERPRLLGRAYQQ